MRGGQIILAMLFLVNIGIIEHKGGGEVLAIPHGSREQWIDQEVLLMNGYLASQTVTNTASLKLLIYLLTAKN